MYPCSVGNKRFSLNAAESFGYKIIEPGNMSRSSEWRLQVTKSMRSFIYTCSRLSPFETLAIEEALLDSVKPDEIILYLYQHNNSIIVGRNQNTWAECRQDVIEKDGVAVARRISGGGAVYHDLGNLNFSFIMPRCRYDFMQQSAVLLDAARSVGVDAALSGRNDIIADGRKFSGNAFCFRGDNAFHHGTLLIDTDIIQMERCLSVNTGKMRAKGVQSVRSRVVNLSELMPQLTVGHVADALIASFSKTYGYPRELTLNSEQLRRASQLSARNADWNWVYGVTPPFDIQFGKRFPWGETEFRFSVKHAVVQSVRIYSDAMNEAYIARLEKELFGTEFRSETLSAAARNAVQCTEDRAMAEDIASLFLIHV